MRTTRCDCCDMELAGMTWADMVRHFVWHEETDWLPVDSQETV